MDPKTVSIGVVAVIALAALIKPPAVTLVAASQDVADQAVTEIGKLTPELAAKHCVRQWVEVRPDPAELRWVCEGAHGPVYTREQDAYLASIAPADGAEIDLIPEDDGAGNVRFHARVKSGELPAKPETVPVEAMLLEAEKVKKDKP